MDIDITFPGGKRVDATIGGFVIHTDQPESLGGANSAPAPFDLFLASIATCAGIYALGFCQARQIATTGLKITQHVDYDAASGLPAAISLSVQPPAGFPAKYRTALLRSVEGCKVKKTIAAQPAFHVALCDEESPCVDA